MPSSANVLVLNRHWVAVGTTTIRRTFVLLVREAAAAVCPRSYEVLDFARWVERSRAAAWSLPEDAARVVRTPRLLLERPEVILLHGYGGVPRREVSFTRRNLYRRDDHACQYCGRRRPSSELSIDHVVPRSLGGPTTWENCVLACVRCNTKKANKTLREVGFTLLRPPRRPTWSPLLDALPQARPQSWAQFLAREQQAS